jgi:hypothetical protein
VEVFLALGLLAFGILFFAVGMKVLPMEVPEDEHEHERDLDEVLTSEAPDTRAAVVGSVEPALGTEGASP